MSIVLSLSSLALKGAAQASGMEVIGGGVDALVGFLRQRFADNSTRLTRALDRSATRAWRAVEVALAGTSWWDRCKLTLSTAEQRAIRAQVQAFLQAHPLDGVDGHGPDFRGQCVAQLQAARKAGLLTPGKLDPDELARRVGDLSRFGDRSGLVEAEHRALADVATGLRRHGYEALAAFLELRPASGPPLLSSAMRYFFQKEVESDRELFQGLAYARLESLAEGQAAGFAGLAEALDEHGARLEALLADVQSVVVQTRGDVLDVKTELARQGQQIQELGQAVLEALKQHQLERRELHVGDSLSIRDEGERRLVKELVRRYRSLPAQERQTMPALLNAVGKLEVVAGDFEAAQRDFGEVATLVADASGRAEAAHNAFRAALERRAWSEALAALKEAITLDPGRFAPFPAEKYEPEKILGAGGFGVAFLCRNRHSGGLVVIKTLRREGLERDLGEVFREAQALEELEHPAIIRVRDCDYADAARTRPYLVMDYFQGQNLAEHVEQHGPLSPAELLGLARLVAEGLQRAHGKSILHRDVKPANLLVLPPHPPAPSPTGGRGGDRPAPPLSPRGRGGVGGGEGAWQAKLIDFGLALKADTAKSTMKASLDRTLAGSSIAGTLEYAAPEQMGKLKGVAVGTWSDVYGFGKTCCFALFGTANPTFQHWQQLPRELADLLGRCLSEQPRQRPQDFTAVLAELDRLLKPQPIPVLEALPEVVPVREARRPEPRREAPRRHEEDEPRRRPRRFEEEPSERRPASGGFAVKFFFVTLGVMLLFGGVVVFAIVMGLSRGPNTGGTGRPSFSMPGWPVPGPEVKYEPIPEAEFPAILQELKGKPGPARLREIAGRLGETEPTKKQKEQHERATKTVPEMLAQKPPAARPEALEEAKAIDDIQHVSDALDPLMKAPDEATLLPVTRALRRWGTKKNVEGLIPLTKILGSDPVRLEAALALAHLKVLRGLRAVAEMFKGNWGNDHVAAQKALVACGPDAEPVVIDLLAAPDSHQYAGRKAAIAVLEAIGTEKSLGVLRGLENDSQVGGQAKNAIAAIRDRSKDGKK